MKACEFWVSCLTALSCSTFNHGSFPCLLSFAILALPLQRFKLSLQELSKTWALTWAGQSNGALFWHSCSYMSPRTGCDIIMHTNNVFSLKDGRHVQAVWSDSFIKAGNYSELGREGQGADLPKCKAAIQKDLERLEECVNRNIMKWKKCKYKILHLEWINLVQQQGPEWLHSSPIEKDLASSGSNEG